MSEQKIRPLILAGGEKHKGWSTLDLQKLYIIKKYPVWVESIKT